MATLPEEIVAHITWMTAEPTPSAKCFKELYGHMDWDAAKEGVPQLPFNYFCYGAALSEVEIDCLTGDMMPRSKNAATCMMFLWRGGRRQLGRFTRVTTCPGQKTQPPCLHHDTRSCTPTTGPAT